ncbi:hypothetical protein [Fibrella aquatilis]|uniref:Uncharacterized protein n=1 Tax=Fibrella aquatilis TaxID=2817059 RepID=A0A939GDF9_9BACT|nr:hypothetical protein [Fibrella aquatilis]MBO0934353.1 hypothetical protein [Fibrella aquatilis]
MLTLKEGVRKKYEAYRLAKPGKYPVLKFNSYPAPYEHLRNSFKEELTGYGQADMQEALAAIPSTKTFAKIFHEGYIIKDENVLNACYLYAWGKPRPVASEEASSAVLPDVSKPVVTSLKTPLIGQANRRVLLFAALLIGAGLVAYVAIGYYRSTLPPSGLVIISPTKDMTVPRIMIAQGKVAHAKTVWMVIHNPEFPDYYVQVPIKVGADGAWEGLIYTGSREKGNIGVRFQVRAFVNPTKPLIEEQVLHAWPEAELSSGIIEVIRGPQDVQPPTP